MSFEEDIKVQFINPQAPYQPRFSEVEYALLKARRLNDLTLSVQSSLGQGSTARCGRLCVDRLKLIYDAIRDEIQLLSFLDLGCANGMFCISFKALGAKKVIGIDNNEHSQVLRIDIPHCLDQARIDAEQFGLSIDFRHQNLINIIESENSEIESDVVLALSVFHHLYYGYGYLPLGKPTERLGSKADIFFGWVKNHCRKYLIFETHEQIFLDWGEDKIEQNLLNSDCFQSVTCLGKTSGFDGVSRGLWLCLR